MATPRRGLDPLAQIRRERNWFAPAHPAIEQGASRDRSAEHLLQAHPLGTELDLIGPARFGSPPLVLHGERSPEDRPIGGYLTMELDDVGLTNQPHPVGPQR